MLSCQPPRFTNSCIGPSRSRCSAIQHAIQHAGKACTTCDGQSGHASGRALDPHRGTSEMCSHVVFLVCYCLNRLPAFFPPIVNYINSMIPKWLHSMLDPILADLDAILTSPYADELRGVCCVFVCCVSVCCVVCCALTTHTGIATASGLRLGDVVFMNFYYEFSAFCTSIIGQTSCGSRM